MGIQMVRVFVHLTALQNCKLAYNNDVYCPVCLVHQLIIFDSKRGYELGVKSLVAMAMRMHDLDWDPNIDNC